MKNSVRLTFILVTVASFCQLSFAQERAAVATKSRDTATGFIGAMNFSVGRYGRDCLGSLNRSETPQEFVAIWQRRNAKYLNAASKYLAARLDEAQAKGEDVKNAVLQELASVNARSAADIQSRYAKYGKAAACKRMVAAIDQGMLDIGPGVPMFDELEALVQWAQNQ